MCSSPGQLGVTGGALGRLAPVLVTALASPPGRSVPSSTQAPRPLPCHLFPSYRTGLASLSVPHRPFKRVLGAP